MADREMTLALRVRADLGDAARALRGAGRDMTELGRAAGAAERQTARMGESFRRAGAGVGAADTALAGFLGRLTQADALEGRFAAAAAGIESQAQHVARTAGQALAGAFADAEDALGRLAVSGSLNFRALADSILADLARLAVREAVTGPLAAALGGALGGVFGGKGGSAARIFHGGGVVGAGAETARQLPPAVFAAAPRFHGGGVAGLRADEVPAVLRRGEEVLTAADPRHARNMRAGPAPEVQIVIENRGAPQTARAGEPRFDGRRWVIAVVTEDIDEGGAVARAVERGFGARPAVA